MLYHNFDHELDCANYPNQKKKKKSVTTFSELLSLNWLYAIDLDLVPDRDPPNVSGCPDNIEASNELGTPGTTVSWTEPTVTDASSVTTVRSHSSGSTFLIGETHVAYIYTDASQNIAACSFSVIVETG